MPIKKKDGTLSYHKEHVKIMTSLGYKLEYRLAGDGYSLYSHPRSDIGNVYIYDPYKPEEIVVCISKPAYKEGKRDGEVEVRQQHRRLLKEILGEKC